MTQPTPPPIPPRPGGVVDAAGVVAVDSACRKCGYNLRGLHEQGRCPECGTPVGLSTQGDFLRFCDPLWLRVLERGLNLIIWGMAISVVLGVLGGCVFRQAQGLNIAINLLGSLIGVYGAWLLTAPDPSGLGDEKYGRVRRIVRVALVTGLASSAATIYVTAAPVSGVLMIIWGLLIALAGLIGVVGEFAKYIYMERLAMRIPNPRIARSARTVRWGFTIGSAIVVLGVAIGVLGGANRFVTTAVAGTGLATPAAPARLGMTTSLILAIAFAVIGSILTFVFAIMAIVLQVRLRRAIREQVIFARDTWSRAAAQRSRDG